MLASGCRTGEEFEMAWNSLQQEARQSTQFLSRDMGGPWRWDWRGQVMGEWMGALGDC